MKQAINSQGTQDHIISSVIDNINFELQSTSLLLDAVLEKGSKPLKIYALQHIKALMHFQNKELILSMSHFQSGLQDREIVFIVKDIIAFLICENRNVDFLYSGNFIQVLLEIDRNLVYQMIKNESTFLYLESYIKEDIESIDLLEICNRYYQTLERSMRDIFPNEDTQTDFSFLNINLPVIENQYNHNFEYFWIKQLPFNVNVVVMENYAQNTSETLVLNCFLEYDRQSRLVLSGRIVENIVVNIKTDSLKFICMLGDRLIDSNSRIIFQGNFLTFDLHDFKLLKEQVIGYMT